MWSAYHTHMQAKILSDTDGLSSKQPSGRHRINRSLECGHESETLHLVKVNVFERRIVQNLRSVGQPRLGLMQLTVQTK